jgi:hypothetical protein
MIVINIFQGSLVNHELAKMLLKVGSLENIGLNFYLSKKLFGGT